MERQTPGDHSRLNSDSTLPLSVTTILHAVSSLSETTDPTPTPAQYNPSNPGISLNKLPAVPEPGISGFQIKYRSDTPPPTTDSNKVITNKPTQDSIMRKLSP